jgi:CheY-like chemotaxis protein
VAGRVLLVEDNEANRYLATYLLEHAGFQVAHAANGESALALAAGGSFDLILMDLQLPGIDGYTVVRALRAMPELARVPIVAVTSFAMTGDREMALAAGCDGYIVKPIDPDVFIASIRRHLQPGQPGGAQ